MQAQTTRDESHGSPYDRGSVDAYYGRPARPHIRIFTQHQGMKIFTDVFSLYPEQVRDYHSGYDEQVDRKIW